MIPVFSADKTNAKKAPKIIKVPVCFTAEWPKGDGVWDQQIPQIYNYLPNMINMVVVKNKKGTRLAIPNPLFNPHYNYLIDQLKDIGYKKSELKPVKVYGFMEAKGGAHCSTNTEKVPPKK